jgi:hypothetical protein
MAGLRRRRRDRSATRNALIGRKRSAVLDAADEQVEGVLGVRKDVLERRGREMVTAYARPWSWKCIRSPREPSIDGTFSARSARLATPERSLIMTRTTI